MAEKPSTPGGIIGKRRRRSEAGGRPTAPRKGISTSGASLKRPDCPRAGVAANINRQIASRQLQLLPYMGRPQDETSARRDTGETGQPNRVAITKAVTDVTITLWITV